jgi:hypothetical protein
VRKYNGVALSNILKKTFICSRIRTFFCAPQGGGGAFLSYQKNIFHRVKRWLYLESGVGVVIPPMGCE